VGKARSLPLSGAPESYFTWVGTCLTRKNYTILERLAKDEHSSLLKKIVTLTSVNSFITFTPGADVIKLFMTVIYKFLY
jgi:hypothetical protein